MCVITECNYKCGHPYTPPFILIQPCARSCGRALGVRIQRYGPEACGLCGERRYTPQSLEMFAASAHKIPRFLFRGFQQVFSSPSLPIRRGRTLTFSSGANHATLTGLNTQTGVYPYLYPPQQHSLPARPRVDAALGVPDTQLQPLHNLSYENLIDLAEHHVEFNIRAPVRTPFTSWSADWTTALWFGAGSYAGRREYINVLSRSRGYVCILDTATWLPEEERGRRIFHAPDLAWPSLPFEYFIHGPVHGPAFRCVPIADIQRALGCTRFPLCSAPHGAPRAAPPPPAPPAAAPPANDDILAQFAHLRASGRPLTPARSTSAPAAPAAVPAEHIPDHDEMAYAVRVGSLFQLPDDRNIDSTLVVAAFMLARTQFPVTPGSGTPVEEAWLLANLFVTGPGRPLDMTVERRAAQAIFTHLFPPGLPLPPISDLVVANQHMDTLAQPQLQWAKNLLLRVDDGWRSLARGPWAWTARDWRPAVTTLRGPRHVCPPAVPTGDRRGSIAFVTPPRRHDPARFARSPSTPG